MCKTEYPDYTLVPCAYGDALWQRVVDVRLRVYVDEQKVPLPDVAMVLSNSVAVTGQVYCRPSENDLRRHLEKAVGEDWDDR